MGIDIYYYSQHTSPKNEDYIWTIDELSFLRLSNCMLLYEKRTGRVIDEYGDLELPDGTLGPLLNCVHDIMEDETDDSTLAIMSKLSEILIEAHERKQGIGFYGD